MNSADLKLESSLWKDGYLVIGVDEVGRGALAGPLFVGGVIFNPLMNPEQKTHLLSYGINDSKKIKPNKRKMLAKIIQKESLAYHISKINVAKINRFGIGKTTLIAMREVVKTLREKLDAQKEISDGKRIFVLVDKFYIKYLRGVGLKNQKGIVHGDEISLSIAAASIIAKVARDNHMKRLSAKYPAYNFARNKGYGTLFHRTALAKLGPTPIHRLDFIRKSCKATP